MDHPEAKRMMADIRADRVEALIFSKLAQLARNTQELLEMAEFFRVPPGQDRRSTACPGRRSSPRPRVSMHAGHLLSLLSAGSSPRQSSSALRAVPKRSRARWPTNPNPIPRPPLLRSRQQGNELLPPWPFRRAVVRLQPESTLAPAARPLVTELRVTVFTLWAQRPIQEVGDIQRSGPGEQVGKVEAPGLGSDDAEDVVPLAVGDLAAEAVPGELAEEGVFGGLDPDGARRILAQGVGRGALHLGAIEGAGAGDEEVHLEARGVVDEIEMRAALDGAAHGLFIQVEVCLEAGGEGREVARHQLGDEVEILGLPRYAVDRAGERAADVVAHTQVLQDGGDLEGYRPERGRHGSAESGGRGP